MLQVNIEKIIPVTEARDMFNRIVDEVEGTDELYVLTKNGKPSAVVVGVNHLEKLTGGEHSLDFEGKQNTNTDVNIDRQARTESASVSQDNPDNNSIVAEQAATISQDNFNSNELAETTNIPSAESQAFLNVNETSNAPTTENFAAVSEPVAAPQNYDQIQPVPDDFSASLSSPDANFQQDLATEQPVVGDASTEMITPDINTATNDVLATEEESQPDTDPFSSASTIVENPEEDGLPPNNQNTQLG